MSDDRAAKLESRIRELEATLSGLTDELLDTKDRLETVEEAIAGEESSHRRTDIVDGDLLGRERSAETGLADEAASADSGESNSAGDAETDGTSRSAEGTNAENRDDAEDSGNANDIIVA